MHFGITGEDLVRETIAAGGRNAWCWSTALGFGFANVVVAVPQAWIDVRSMADLDDVATAFRLKHDRRMRVATKYVNLTRSFFAEHGIVDYRIVESAGATEGAPAAGTAELIVDITTSGATLAANGLKVIDERRDAALAGQSGRRPRARPGAPPNARRRGSCSTASPPIAAPRPSASCARAFPAATTRCSPPRRKNSASRAPFGGPTSSGMLTLHCPPGEVHALATFLREHGASTVVVGELDYVFARENPLYAKLEARLSPPMEKARE